MFSQDEILRYVRHFSVARIGMQGQSQLKKSRVLCVGAGGIGSPLLLYLAASGVGHLTVIDGDIVDISNLQRQVLFDEKNIGQSKAKIAGEKLAQLNQHCELSIYEERITIDNVEQLINAHDVVVDGSDNYATRYLLGDACALHHIPLISASVYQFSGQLLALNNQTSPCYRCLYPEQPAAGVIPNCAEAGVLGSVPGVLGVMAATEVVKHLLDFPEKLNNQLATIDLMNVSIKKYPVLSRATCKICQQHKSLADLHQTEDDSVDAGVKTLSVQELAEWVKQGKPYTLIDVRQAWERDICRIENDIHIPLAEIPQTFEKFPEPVVLYCRVGQRSLVAAHELKQKGAEDIYNLNGGILEWIKEIEPDKRVY